MEATLFVFVWGGESVMFIATGDYYTSSLSVCLSGESYASECVGSKTGSALTSLSRGISSKGSDVLTAEVIVQWMFVK